MMNNLKKICLTASLCFITIQQAQADLRQEHSKLITGSKIVSENVKTVNNVAQAEAFLLGNKKVQSTEKTLRCWQHGVMILAEHDWNNMAAQNPILSNTSGQKIYTFDHGETFCLYIGN